MALQGLGGAVKATLALPAIAAAIGLGTAHASPFDQYYALSLPLASVAVDLHGDLNGNIATLNIAPPVSQLTVDMHLPPPELVFGLFNFPNVCGVLPCSNVSVLLNNVANLAVPTWRFDLGGTVDTGANTFNLTGTPQPPGTIASLHTTYTPLIGFSVDPNLGPIQQIAANTLLEPLFEALNNALPKIIIDISGEWDSVALALDSNLILETVLSGILTIGVEVKTTNPLINSIADTLFPLLQNQFLTQLTNELVLGGFIPFLNISVPGMQQQCEVSPEDLTEFAVTCTGRTQLASAVAPTVDAPEPATLAVLGLGLAGLGLIRRRRAS